MSKLLKDLREEQYFYSSVSDGEKSSRIKVIADHIEKLEKMIEVFDDFIIDNNLEEKFNKYALEK